MHEIFDKLTEFVWGVWRYRWLALATSWLVALLGWFMIAQVDARYPASARLFVDTNRILVPLLQNIAIQPNVKQRIAVMSKTVLSRPNLNLLIDKHQLDRTDDGIVERNSVLDKLAKDIVIRDVNNSRSIYSITYSHEDPKVALSVLESVINIFISTSFNEERDDNKSAQAFIDKQIADYEQRLTAAEKRLADFKRKHAGTLPGEQGGYYKRMENLVALQRTSQLELQEATKEAETLRRNLAQEEQKILDSSSDQSPYDARITKLEGELDDLLVRFTERHPKVAILKESINDLRARKRNDGSGINSSGSAALQSSIVYQELSTLLAESRATVSKLRVRDANYKARLIELRGRESARLTGNLDTDSNDVNIRQLDPPFVPPRPTDPDRLLLNILTLIGAVSIGILVAFFQSILHPVFYNKRSLEHLTKIPVLGSVSMSSNNVEVSKTRKNLLKFSALAVLLPIVCALILYIQLRNDTLYDSFKISSPVETQSLGN